ncbi:unnamed protein product [Lepeophtheirus salmonis]|uniref:(salmon louse) hypothetical protein n=1 Tax=Lepeophtheirus salmonis TaxID=72036 RepID=A0A7R8CND2_LEPSM|nr:unnamed protein product [Lepeophtheirus salmonis]CAF2874295.1 unnamed protein product [Lepeophtheirus salmonis]
MIYKTHSEHVSLLFFSKKFVSIFLLFHYSSLAGLKTLMFYGIYIGGCCQEMNHGGAEDLVAVLSSTLYRCLYIIAFATPPSLSICLNISAISLKSHWFVEMLLPHTRCNRILFSLEPVYCKVVAV